MLSGFQICRLFLFIFASLLLGSLGPDIRVLYLLNSTLVLV